MTTAVRDVTLGDLLERAEALVPRLRERARRAEELRRLPDETFREFMEAGFFKVFQPARFGGFELDYGRTQVELCHVLGQGCGSSAWVQCVIACHAWALGMFPPEAKEAVWGGDEDALIASSFAAKTGRGRRTDGGYYVEGDWQFSSGSNLCTWVVLGTPIFEDGNPRPARMLWTLLPKSEWDVVDTWYAAGLKGTASNDIRVKGAFVPDAFTLDTSLCDGRPTPGSAINSSYMFRLPLWPPEPAFLSRSSRDTSYAVRMCVQAIDRLLVAVGAHGMLHDNPIQRAARDAHAVANHLANSFDIMGVGYARYALGLPPISM